MNEISAAAERVRRVRAGKPLKSVYGKNQSAICGSAISHADYRQMRFERDVEVLADAYLATDSRLHDAVFVPDDQGGHIECAGKIWRVVEASNDSSCVETKGR